MKRSRFLILAVPFLVAVSACHKTPDPVKPTDVSAWKGLVFNEIAAHDQTKDAETWVELVNTTSATMDLSGLGLYITDAYFKGQRIWQAASGAKLAAGERLVLSTADESLVTGISSADQFLLKLAVEDGTAVDEFDRSKAFASPAAAYPRGSYQRIPDGTGDWKNMTYNSIGKENKVFSLADYKHTAVWAWSSHISDMIADDFAKLKNLKKLGYDHILMNYVAFDTADKRNTLKFLDKCDELDIAVHCWMQCFYKGGWVSPIDDTTKSFKEDVYADIRNHAKTYLENYGVKGLHLDYIRFGGTASKHNHSAEVNSVNAVNRCCRELREIADSYEEGLVMSAALMPEPDTEYAYGQNPAQMGQYIHILMPMEYRYSYGWGDNRCKTLTNWFCEHSGGAEVWAGITTYTGNDSGGVHGMDAAGIRKDIDIFMDSKANGLVLFRYGLGTFPDVNDLP
jgi:hypothetical protein